MQLWDSVRQVCLRAEEEKAKSEASNQQFMDLLALIVESGICIGVCNKCGERRLYSDNPFGARELFKCAGCGDGCSVDWGVIKKEVTDANNKSI